MIYPIVIVASLGLVAAQDVYSCPDGWEKEVGKGRLDAF